MRNLILCLVAALMSIGLMAQNRSELKGPAYKNYKPWLNKTEPVVVYTLEKQEKLIGPAYKNRKPWDEKGEVKYTAVVFGSERSKLRGPAYKNYKPWRKTGR